MTLRTVANCYLPLNKAIQEQQCRELKKSKEKKRRQRSSNNNDNGVIREFPSHTYNLTYRFCCWLAVVAYCRYIYTAPLSCYCVLTPKILIAQYLFSSSYYINSFFPFFTFSLTSPYSSCKSFLKEERNGAEYLESSFSAIMRVNDRTLSFTLEKQAK